MFALDFQDCKKPGCILQCIKHCLHQRRKNVHNKIDSAHGLTLQKSTKSCNVKENNYFYKRKLKEFKLYVIHCRNVNASKIEFDILCGENNAQDKKVQIQEVASSEKVVPNWELLQVLLSCL